jgi:bis(5'-nucleosyl)-tetraphosphatase (symmetrical)
MSNISKLPRTHFDEPNWRVYRHIDFDDFKCFQNPKGRLMIFGDPHGCSEELSDLISKVNYDKTKDIMVCVGDFVGKGPDPVGVIKLCLEHDIIGVLGNHDYTVLRLKDDPVYREKHLAGGGEKRSKFSYDEFGKTMPPECEDFLRRLPHAISFANFRRTVVHAGFNYWKPITDQDVYEVMHMRFTSMEQKVLKVHEKMQPGAHQWATKYNGRIQTKTTHVVFGHDAKAGLQRCDFATGLDTGVCYGEKLTALVCMSQRKEDDVIVEVPSRQPRVHAPKTEVGLSADTVSQGAEVGMLRAIVALGNRETEAPNIASAIVVARLVSPGCGYMFSWNSIMSGEAPDQACSLQHASIESWSLFILSAVRAALQNWADHRLRDDCLGVAQDVFDAHDSDSSNGEVRLTDQALDELCQICKKALAEGKVHKVLRYCSM